MASSTTSPTSGCRYEVFFCVSKTQTEFLRGMGGALLLHHCVGVGHLETSRQQPGATSQDTYSVSGTHSPGRGFPPLTPLFKRDSVTHRRDGRDAPIDLLSSPLGTVIGDNDYLPLSKLLFIE